METLQPLLDLLGGSQGKLATAIVWIGALRLAAKPISGIIQMFMSRLIIFIQGTPELDDDAFLVRILQSKAYRFVAFIVDLIASVKLPSSATVTEAAASNAGKTGLGLLFAGLALAALSLTAPGCRNLDPDGPYRSDRYLYEADMAITGAYATFSQFVKWEYENREILRQWPEIKKAADHVRRNAKLWITSAMNLREAYSKAPNPDTRAALEKALDILQSGLYEATKYMVAHEAAKKNIVPKSPTEEIE